MEKKIIRRNLFLLAPLLLAAGCSLFQKPNFSAYLKQHLLVSKENKLDSFSRVDSLPSDPESLQTFAASSGEVVRIQSFPVQNEAEAKNMIKYRSQMVQGLYADRVVDYQGKITVQESCLQKNRVKSEMVEQGQNLMVKFDLQANKNFVYGSCLESETAFKSQYLLLYCGKTKTLQELKFFYPKNAADLADSLLTCAQ